MNSLFARCNQRLAIEDRIDKILHQDGVRIGSILKWNLNVPDLGFGKAEFGGFAELNHIRVISRESELVPFEDYLAPCAGDFESVAAGRFPGGRNKCAGATVRKFEISRNVVLHFDMMEPAELAETAHTRGRSEQPLHDIQIMEALIEQYSPALPLPGRAPAAAGIIRLRPVPIGHDPTHPHQLAQFA